MERFRKAKSSRQKIFLLLAFFMVILTAFFVIYFTVSLGDDINATLKLPPKIESSAQFDIQGFQKLNLTQ